MGKGSVELLAKTINELKPKPEPEEKPDGGTDVESDSE